VHKLKVYSADFIGFQDLSLFSKYGFYTIATLKFVKMFVSAAGSITLCFFFFHIATGKQIWYNTAAGTNWERNALFVGNGKLGAAFFGGIQNDQLILNIDSLWTGGPFQNDVSETLWLSYMHHITRLANVL